MNVPNDTKYFEWTFQAQCQQVMLIVVEKCCVIGFSRPSRILPKYIILERMKEPKIATRIVLRGLKVVTKTGPFCFIIRPWM